MCGVMGYVRTAEPTVLTWEVIEATFAGIESRGRDAAGFSAIGDRSVVCKRAMPSSRMATTERFRTAIRAGAMMIGHARAATHGEAKYNQNNHPFWTTDGRYVLVHNGIIRENPEHMALQTECDSEIALRMVETHGIRGAMERMAYWDNADYTFLIFDTKERALYATRNHDRPLVFANLSREIGGYLIASTREIMEKGLRKAGITKTSSKLIETMPYSIYRFEPDVDDIEPTRLQAFWDPERARKWPKAIWGNRGYASCKSKKERRDYVHDYMARNGHQKTQYWFNREG